MDQESWATLGQLAAVVFFLALSYAGIYWVAMRFGVSKDAVKDVPILTQGSEWDADGASFLWPWQIPFGVYVVSKVDVRRLRGSDAAMLFFEMGGQKWYTLWQPEVFPYDPKDCGFIVMDVEFVHRDEL